MQTVVEGKPFTLQIKGEELAKVLLYYGYIPDVSSNEYKIVCPFHNDMNPSMSVNLDTGRFFCYGCGAYGDAFDFVQMLNKDLNSLQCMFKLFDILKSNEVCKIDFSHRRKVVKDYKEAYDISWDYYYGLSEIDWINQKSDEIDHCKQYMLDRGFTSETLNKCKAKVTYNNPYPIIFPMLDNGEFKGWVCRTTDKEVEAKRKYLYNTGFSRATTLVGDYKNQKYVFVVEGYMDRLKFVQYGIDNVVAILGWKMSKEQEDKLKRSNVEVIISALDNDECGIKGTKYLKTIFPNVVRFKYLKDIKDPGQIETQETFNKMYNKTMLDVSKLIQSKGE